MTLAPSRRFSLSLNEGWKKLTCNRAAANRRFTFGVQGRQGAAAYYAAGLTAFLLGLAMTNL